MFVRKKGKTATFTKRTLLLLTPIPITVGLISISSRSLIKEFDAALTDWEAMENPISNLSMAMNMKSIPQGVKNYGDIFEFQNDNKKYQIEQLHPFNPLYLGSNYGYKIVVVEEESKGIKLSNKNKLAEQELKFKKTSDGKYTLAKEDFYNTKIKNKGNLHLVIGFEVQLDNDENLPIFSSIDLSQILFSKERLFPIISTVEIKDKGESPKLHSIKFSKKDLEEKLEISLESEVLSPIKKISIEHFYMVFSNNPSISFSGLFETKEEQTQEFINDDQVRIKRIFLDRWVNKNAANGYSESKFEFSTDEGFWSSYCLDPYKVGGFIDEDKKGSKAQDKPNKADDTGDKSTYRKQQASTFESFKPFDNISEKSTSIEPYTTPNPCSGIEEKTKNLMKTNLNLAPEEIKNLVEDKNNENAKYKVIQSAIKKNTNNLYVSAFEEANQTIHSFNIKIEKDTLIKQLIDHPKLQNINKFPEVSSQLQVNIPYLLTIYDPTENYIKHQKINVNVFLDIRSLYNQSQFKTSFLSYDIANNNNKSSLGILGKINFEMGLELDIDSNLNIKSVVNTQGFFKKINKGNCDPRKRNGNGCSDQDRIPAFVVLKISEDPSLSSFYVDGRSGDKTSQPPQIKGGETTTLEKFKSKLDNISISYVKNLDNNANAEVFFDRIDVADPVAQKLNYLKTENGKIPSIQGKEKKDYFLAAYYIPRRNYGEVSISDENNLDEMLFHISGSATLGGSFFTSMHYNTKLTYCSSTTDNGNSSSLTQECADGRKYEKIEKDQTNSYADSSIFKTLKISFDDLKKTSEEKPKTFDFQTIINKPNDKKFDDSKEKLEFVMKEDGSFSKDSDDSSKAPDFAFTSIWYQIIMWWDGTNKKVCYYNQLTPISAIANLSESDPKGIKNKESTKSVGSAAKAGFQISKIEFKYKKKSNNT